MSTQKQKNLERLIFKTFDKEIEGTDIYNHNGSMWIIFTDEKKWVVEYTKDQTLWYNYSLFNNMMMLFGMDNNETAEYVKTWFENRFLFKPKIEDTIQNGVKRTLPESIPDSFGINDTIQNGVKQTELSKRDFFPEDILQNGIKDTKSMCGKRGGRVGNTIENGVKYMMSGSEFKNNQVDDIIKDGVKEVKSMKQDRNSRHGIIKIEDEIPIHIYMDQVQDVVQNGVKHSEDGDWLDGDERIENIIQNGVKQ